MPAILYGLTIAAGGIIGWVFRGAKDDNDKKREQQTASVQVNIPLKKQS